MHSQQVSLVMEARGLLPQRQSFYITELWSQLYKSDDYFLDISCQAANDHATLIGQIMLSSGIEASEKADIVLYQHNQMIAKTRLDDEGYFKLSVTGDGIFDLEISFANAHITVPQLTIP